jgi:hypothetical protein
MRSLMGVHFFWPLRSSPFLAGIFIIKSFDRTLLLETLILWCSIRELQ